MSQTVKPSSLPSVELSHRPLNLYNNQILSDVQIKLRGGQHIFAHKAFLARRSEWFLKAFTGGFPVASSNEICLDDEDDDPKAICAMIRHIYDLTYDGFAPPFTPGNTDLMFHIDVFASADKYFVPSLRPLVVQRFTQLMQATWSARQQDFCKAIQRLCGPDAVSFADKSLQASAALFCSEHIMDLIKLDAFVKTLEDGEPFAGRLLTAVLRGKADCVVKTVRCHDCKSVPDEKIKQSLGQKCIGCNSIHPAYFGPSSSHEHYKNFMPL
ncbi:hypothetical protein E4T49_00139 [Aureobasidium sp. EXF-10728]|nr:hypothetical protein E4T49_00139 [Aureobasidium sp. EXF-10728]